MYTYNDKDVEIFTVPLGECQGSEGEDREQELALVKKGTRESTFVDPDNLERGEFTCAVSWRALERPWQFSPTWQNYIEVWETIEFPRLMGNTTNIKSRPGKRNRANPYATKVQEITVPIIVEMA